MKLQGYNTTNLFFYATNAKLPAEKFMLSSSNLTDIVISDFPASSL